MDPVTIGVLVAQELATQAASEALLEAAAETVVQEAGSEAIAETALETQLEQAGEAGVEGVTEQAEATFRSRNAELAGQLHPETQVPFHARTVELPDGTLREGVFPEFEARFETVMPTELQQASDYQQFRASNEALRVAAETDPAILDGLNDRQVEQVREGFTPDGHTWHHHEDVGRMQLVDTRIHMQTGHTGGKEIWGGGR